MMPFANRIETIRLGWAVNPANEFNTTRLLMTERESKHFPSPAREGRVIRCHFVVKDEQIIEMNYPNNMTLKELIAAQQEVIDSEYSAEEFYICYRVNDCLVCPTRIDKSRVGELTGYCHFSHIDLKERKLYSLQ